MSDVIVVVGIFSDLTRAYLARARLESAGVRSHLLDQHFVGLNPFWGHAAGGVPLVVGEKDAESASSILSAKSTINGHDLCCPACGRESVREHKFGRLLAYVSAGLLGVPIGRSRSKFTCGACKSTWRRWGE